MLDGIKSGDGRILGNFTGAFADGAVLFPIVLLLGAKGVLEPVAMLAGAGLAYITAAVFFRIPMPVQPLKSIAVAALAVGASGSEVRAATLLLGLVCLALGLVGAQRILARVPARLVQQVQVGLGALLLIQAWRSLGGGGLLPRVAVVLLTGLVLLAPSWRGVSWLGLLAVAAIFYGLYESLHNPAVIGQGLPGPTAPELRISLVVALLLPQLVLTLSNSVLGTQAAARNYYPQTVSRVTVRSLLYSIGVGNLLAAIAGTLPFCHGSGGLTAHYHGGARDWWSGCVIGGFLLLLAGISLGERLNGFAVPALAVSVLLFATGMQHFRLAKPTFQDSSGRWLLAVAFFVAFTTQNLLLVLVSGALGELALWAWRCGRGANSEESV